ncbi:hypothetical protein Bca101_030185 [Brassica carinata]
MSSTSLEPVRICFDDATITGDEITEILEFLQSDTSDNPSGSNELEAPVDERKRKRTISNRESAKRSRLRKKRRFEDLTEEVNRLKSKNQELVNQLANVLSCGNAISKENNRLKTESVCLEFRLLELYRFLVAMQSPISTNHHGTSSLLVCLTASAMVSCRCGLRKVLPGTFLIISFIGTTADKHREDHKPQEQP